MARQEVISMADEEFSLLENWWRQNAVSPIPLSDYNIIGLGVPLAEDDDVIQNTVKQPRLSQLDKTIYGSSFMPLTLNSPLLIDLKRQICFLHWKTDNCPTLDFPFAPALQSLIPFEEDDFDPDILFHVSYQQLMITILSILRNIIISHSICKKSTIKLFFSRPATPFLLKLIKSTKFEYTSDPNECDVEIVSTPSIVTGNLGTRQSAPAAYRYVIYDCRLYWPIYTKDNTFFSNIPFRNSIFLYSIDYLLGIKSHPLSWALIDDNNVIDMYNQIITEEDWNIDLNTVSLVRSMFNYLLNNIESSDVELYPILTLDNYFDYCSTTLQKRWQRLSFYKQIFTSSNIEGGYAWIYNDNKKAFSLFDFDEDIEGVERSNERAELDNIVDILLEKYGVKISPGINYGTTNSYGRISMMCSTTKFENFINHLQLY